MGGKCNSYTVSIKEQVVWNKSSINTEDTNVKHCKHYDFLQWILKQKLFTKVIENAKLEGLGAET